MRGRGIYVPIIGDPRSLFRALKAGRIAAIDFGGSTEKAGIAAANGMKQAGGAAKGLVVDMQKIAIAAEKSAAVQVKAEVARTARLRKEIVIFNEMAAAAKRGSQQQVLAANLSARAQRELSMSLGVTEREASKLRRTSHAADRELNRGFRGALAGSGIFRALGRSLAFASGGFLIFASAASFLRNSVDAAREDLKTQRSLAAQYRATGQVLAAHRAQIEETVNQESKLGGFTRDELTKSFIVAYRQVGDTTSALRVMSDAAEVARGRNLPLWTSVLGLTKAWGGQTTALRRLGILVPAHTKGMQVLHFVERKFAGQLKANTTAAERFHASLYNLEEAAGGVLLPTISRLQQSFADWASNTKNQAFVQGQLRQVLQGVGGSIEFIYTVTNALTSVVGGWKNAIVLIAGGWLGLKAAGVAAAIAIRASNIKAAWDTVKVWKASTDTRLALLQEYVGANAAADATIVAENEAAAIAAAAAWRAALLSTGIGILAVAAGAAAAYVFTHWSGVKSLFTGPDGLRDEVQGLTQDFYDLARASGKAGDVAASKLAFAQARVNVDQAAQALRVAQSAELAARGTKHHQVAVDNLRLAQQQLIAAQGQLQTAQGGVAAGADAQSKKLAKVVREYQKIAQLTYLGIHGNEPGVGDQSGGGKFMGVPANFTVKQYVDLLQKARDKGVSAQVDAILSALQQTALYKTNPRTGKLTSIPRKLTSRDLPTKQQIRLIVKTALDSDGKKVVSVIGKNKYGFLSLIVKGPLGAALGFAQPPAVKKPPTPAPLPPPALKPIKDFSKWLNHNFGLLSAIASSTTGGGDDMKVARDEQAAIMKLIKQKRLHGDALIAAYQELGNVNQTLAGDVKKAADFATRFDRKFALGFAKASAVGGKDAQMQIAREARAWVKAQIASGKLNRQQLTDAYSKLADLNDQLASAAKDATSKAKQARDSLRQKIEEALGQMGELFAGPILAPSDTEIKQQLGVLPPKMGTINRDLAAQNAETAAWLKDIQKLRKEGAPKQLIQQLIAAGPEQAALVHQLATSSKAQIRKYFKEFAQRVKLGKEIATVKMTAKNVDLIAQNVNYKGGKPHKGMQTGGPVPGRGRGDHVPALLEPGELVVSRAGVARLARLLGTAGTAAALHNVATGRRTGGARTAATGLGGLGRLPALHAPQPLGRVVLRANTVLLRADTVHLAAGAGRGRDRGGDTQPLIFEVDGDVFARASLRRHQRSAKRQVVQVRGRRGGSKLALG